MMNNESKKITTETEVVKSRINKKKIEKVFLPTCSSTPSNYYHPAPTPHFITYRVVTTVYNQHDQPIPDI